METLVESYYDRIIYVEKMNDCMVDQIVDNSYRYFMYKFFYSYNFKCKVDKLIKFYFKKVI